MKKTTRINRTDFVKRKFRFLLSYSIYFLFTFMTSSIYTLFCLSTLTGVKECSNATAVILMYWCGITSAVRPSTQRLRLFIVWVVGPWIERILIHRKNISVLLTDNCLCSFSFSQLKPWLSQVFASLFARSWSSSGIVFSKLLALQRKVRSFILTDSAGSVM